MNISGKKVNIGFNSRKGYFFIVLIMFCLGLSFGLYTVKYMGPADKNDLINYFTYIFSWVNFFWWACNINY